MKKLLIFGNGQIAELAHYYFTHDSNYPVEAFTVDERYKTSTTVFGLPLVAFENIEELYPPEKYDLFIALAYTKCNALRAQKYEHAKLKGYKLASYISSRATIFIDKASIGDNCFILENQVIQPFVRIGNNVTLWSGNHIGHHSVIDDHSFFASHIVISGNVHVQNSCFIGVNATFRDGITIGEKSIIGAGALIMHDVEPGSVYKGERSVVYKRVSREISL